MIQVSTSPLAVAPPASARLVQAAVIVRDAASSLAPESDDDGEYRRFLDVAERLSAVLRSPRVGRRRLLDASPAVLERSGRVRTIVEMIESEVLDDASRLRLARLLFRALVWLPTIILAALTEINRAVDRDDGTMRGSSNDVLASSDLLSQGYRSSTFSKRSRARPSADGRKSRPFCRCRGSRSGGSAAGQHPRDRDK